MSRAGVILDSGDVLIRPANGHRWHPPPAFFEVLSDRHRVIDPNCLDAALRAGRSYLEAVHSVPLLDEEDEHRVWTRYHEIVLDRLDVTRGTRTLAQAMTAEWVSGRHIEPFPWTIPVLNALASQDIPVVVLSDAWPSLRGWFRQLGLDSYIQAMVISGEEGVTKAETRVFDKAVGLLGRDPADVVFVDDYPDYVRAAEAVGLDGLRLRHPQSAPAADLDEITSLDDLLSHLDSNADGS